MLSKSPLLDPFTLIFVPSRLLPDVDAGRVDDEVDAVRDICDRRAE